MKRITRDDVATPYAKCIVCRIGTRSHILEKARYSEFTSEEIMDESDTYSTKQWEEIEEITKFQLDEDAIVMCHKCWVKKETQFINFIDNRFNEWKGDPIENAQNIAALVKSMNYYKFIAEVPHKKTREQIFDLVKTLKEEIK
jgi:hypothetical protein